MSDTKNFDIKTYKNIYALDEYISNNKDELYICALSSTATAMNYKHGSQIKLPIVDIGSMISYILKEWESPYIKVQQKLILKDRIKKIAQHSTASREMLESIEENLDDMISSIRLLCECGIYPDDFNKNGIELSREEEFFIQIWDELEVNDNSINHFKGKLFRELENTVQLQNKIVEGINCSIATQIKKMESLADNINLQIVEIINQISKIEDALNMYIEKVDNDNDTYDIYKEIIANTKSKLINLQDKKDELSKKIESINIVIENYKDIKLDKLPRKIFFQGFYFITPIQERFIQLFRENLDVNIIFLNHYNKDYEALFEVWKKTFLDNGYPEISEWEEIRSSKNDIVTWGEKFAELYCRTDLLKDKEPSNILKIFEYENIISFNSNLNTNNRYYSPAYKELNNILHNPNKTEIGSIKRLITSPLGKFIKYINKIWENNIGYKTTDDIEYDIDLLKQCFATGWLTINNNIHAIDYVDKLERLKPYIGTKFNKKQLEDKLKQRIQDRNYLKKVACKRRISTNIIQGIDFYKINGEKYILEFINAIGEIINGLKVGSAQDKIGINTYAGNIKQQLIDRLLTFKDEFDENEVKIIENFIVLLNFESNSEFNSESDFYIKDVIGAIDDFINIEDNEVDIEINKIIDLKDISIESIVYNDDINICQITNQNMPGTKSRYTWPLSKIFIEKIECEDKNKHLLNRILSIIENNELKNKYLFFNSLQSTDNINISYIKNINNEIIKESPYIKLLADSFTIEPSKNRYNLGKHKYGNSKVNIENVDIEYNNMEQIEEIICDVCPKRWMYFLADDKKNTYELENHKGIYFSRLINIISEKLMIDLPEQKQKHDDLEFYDTTLEYIKMAFPNWSEIEQKNFKKKAFNYRENNKSDTKYFIDNNSDYNTIIIPTIEGIYGDNIYNIKKKINKKNNISLMRGIPYGNPIKDSVCKNCNYLNYCRDAKYPIDLK